MIFLAKFILFGQFLACCGIGLDGGCLDQAVSTRGIHNQVSRRLHGPAQEGRWPEKVRRTSATVDENDSGNAVITIISSKSCNSL